MNKFLAVRVRNEDEEFLPRFLIVPLTDKIENLVSKWEKLFKENKLLSLEVTWVAIPNEERNILGAGFVESGHHPNETEYKICRRIEDVATDKLGISNCGIIELPYNMEEVGNSFIEGLPQIIMSSDSISFRQVHGTGYMLIAETFSIPFKKVIELCQQQSGASK